MIIFRKTDGGERKLASWMRGDSHVERAMDGGRLIGRCDPIFLSQEGMDWKECDEGWEIGTRGALEQAEWLRKQRWLALVAVQDREGNEWMAPVILEEDGTRAFSVPHTGKDWKPTPTKEQAELLELALMVREEIARTVKDQEAEKPDAGLPIEAVCAWAARFLSAAYDLPVAAFAAVGIDDVLAKRVIQVAAGYLAPQPQADGG